MQSAVEKAISRLPQVAFVFSRTRTSDVTADPMSPKTARHRRHWRPCRLDAVDPLCPGGPVRQGVAAAGRLALLTVEIGRSQLGVLHRP
jgi:hypothetical protein